MARRVNGVRPLPRSVQAGAAIRDRRMNRFARTAVRQ